MTDDAARALSDALDDCIYTDLDGEEVTAYLNADAVPIIAAAMHQADLALLRKAAGLVCEHCADDVPRRCMASGIICRGKVGDQAFPWCSANPIHAEISKLKKAGQ